MTIVNRCCCFSLRTGTIIIAFFFLFVSMWPVSLAANTLWGKRNGTESKEWVLWASKKREGLHGGFACGIIQTIFAVFLLIGACTGTAWMLLPWVIVQFIIIIALSVIGFEVFTGLLEVEEKADLGGGSICATIFYFLFSLYSLLVVFSYYQTLRDNYKATLN